MVKACTEVVDGLAHDRVLSSEVGARIIQALGLHPESSGFYATSEGLKSDIGLSRMVMGIILSVVQANE